MIDLSFLGLGVIDLNALGLERIELAGIDARFLIYVGLFLGVLMAFEGLRQFSSRKERRDEAQSRRMKLVEQGKTTDEILQILKPTEEKTLITSLPYLKDLPNAMHQAGMTISPAAFLLACLGGGLIFAVAASQIINPMFAIAIAAILFVITPIALIKFVKKRRMDTFVGQLPDALDLMSRGLKVGHPLNTTLRSVAEEMPDPVGTEFGIVVDQVAYGDDLVDAFTELADRVDVEDVRYLAVAVGIQHGTGGDLASVLSTLARVIRSRISMRRRIRAISSEGRLSAIFLSLLPVFLFSFTSITAPTYYGDVAEDPLFKPAAIVVVILVISNYLVLRKLVNFRF